MEAELYFAYGSNLSSQRLVGRVASARPRGAARLEGFALRTDKRGADGSGKANLAESAADVVWGVVYALDPADWPALDACETGYERIAVTVALGGEVVSAWTYRSDRLTADPVAFDWYRRLMIEGAREHGLPGEWVARLEALPARADGRA